MCRSSPRGEHLVVEQPVAGVLRQRRLADVLLPQRREDTDHDQMRADRPGTLLGVVERGTDLRLPGVGTALRQTPRRHIDLEVEAAELGGPGGIRDRVEHVAVAHRRLGLVVDQVQLDLETHPGPLGLEPRLAQHLREHVEALLHLDPVPAAVLAGEDQRRDVTSHRPSRLALCRTPLPPASHHRTPATMREARPAGAPHPAPGHREAYVLGSASRSTSCAASRAARPARSTACAAVRSRSSASFRSCSACRSSWRA